MEQKIVLKMITMGNLVNHRNRSMQITSKKLRHGYENGRWDNGIGLTATVKTMVMVKARGIPIMVGQLVPTVPGLWSKEVQADRVEQRIREQSTVM